MMSGRQKRKRRARASEERVAEEEEEEEEEEFPEGVACDEEYDEEDVYVMVQMPSSVDGEALLSAASVTMQVRTAVPEDPAFGNR